MDSVLREWDGERAVVSWDERTGSWLFVAIHSTRLGPAAGGTRMKPYDSPASGLLDACRLAGAMTLKMAATGLPMGGGKSVLAVPAGLSAEDRHHVLLRHRSNVEALGGSYLTGPDMNTDSADMDVIGRYAFGRTPESGGSGSSAPDTAVGVFVGIRASVAHVYGSDDLTGRRVLVQGVGAVGLPLVEMLVDAGAVVLVSDTRADRLAEVAEKFGVAAVAPESDLETECDVFAPCATGAVIAADTIPRLRCKIVAGAANNPLLEPEDGERLQRAGILYAPDFVINAGGAIHLIGYEALGWSKEQVDRGLAGIADTLTEIYRRAEAEGISTETAAERLAESRLAAAPA